jgi:YtkA-like
MLHTTTWRTHTGGSIETDAAAVLLSLAGALHVGVAPAHWDHSLAHGIFLLAIGLAELLWAAAFWRGPSQALRTTGALLAGGSIVLWGITRVLPAPFGHGPEEIGAIDAASKLAEALVLVIVVSTKASVRAEIRGPSRDGLRAAARIGAGVAAGLLAFAVGTAAESLTPSLAVADHNHDAAVSSASASAASVDRLQIVVGGIAAPLVSGQDVPVAGDLDAHIALARTATRFDRDLQIELRSGGVPVSGATIVATGHMRFMDHGSFKQAAAPGRTAGEYDIPLPFAMPGEWQIDLEVVTTGKHLPIQLDLDLLD